ncbi:hypothetical protein B296_00044294 [Ensete ventricosum]|uniref:Uncharacterized protein n=1 Tax=Ensete ventricosum TaxID=4639 RepID=A0A426Y7Z3_ENSVE|nr:hypothetical protein B296_00044294 [Ensete ventricosum]
MVDFNHCRPLPGSISLSTAREEEATRQKKKERGRTSTRLDSTPRSLDDPYPVGNDETTARLLLCHVLHRRPETSMAFDVFIECHR